MSIWILPPAARSCSLNLASEVSVRRNSATLRCQHLAKVYDTAHPRAKRKK